MEHFNTVQDLLNWNSEENQSNVKEKAKLIAQEINNDKNPELTLEVARYLLGSLVSWHKRALDVKVQANSDDVHIWAYDLAKLNSALDVIRDVQSPID